MIDFNKLTAFELQGGSHKSADDGLCAMEAVAWLEGVKHSDSPSCTCPVIAAFVRSINDRMPDSDRQKLVAYLPRLVGTVSPEHEQERAEYLAWHAITVVVPGVLERAGLKHHAATLRGLGRHDWEAAANAADAAAAAASCATAAARAANAADNAARAASYAARAASYAAAAAAAASCATAAARAANAAANAAADDADAAAGAANAANVASADWEGALTMLDGVLAIGPQSAGFSADTEARVAAYRERVAV